MNIITKFPIGQYVDGSRSWLRLVDTRLKLISLAVFLITPIWSGTLWRLSLVITLIIITFVSLLPLRIWWRSFIFLIILSFIVGLLSLIATSGLPSLETALRDPDELNIQLEAYRNWNIIEIPLVKLGWLSIGPINISNQAFDLGIKTSTLIFTVIHSVNLILLTTLQEDLVWSLGWFMTPLKNIGLPTKRWLFQLLLALRFIPLVQEEFQNLIKSFSVRSINFRSLGFKNSINVLLSLIERLFFNILLRIDQGAESLLAKSNIRIETKRFKQDKYLKKIDFFVNSLSICFICVAILLRKQYGAL